MKIWRNAFEREMKYKKAQSKNTFSNIYGIALQYQLFVLPKEILEQQNG